MFGICLVSTCTMVSLWPYLFIFERKEVFSVSTLNIRSTAKMTEHETLLLQVGNSQNYIWLILFRQIFFRLTRGSLCVVRILSPQFVLWLNSDYNPVVDLCFPSFFRFVPSKFEEIFNKHAHTNANALTSEELQSMLKANRVPKDFGGWFGLFSHKQNHTLISFEFSL